MGNILTIESPRKTGIQEYSEQALASNEVRIKTLYSGISAGTEMTAYTGSNPYLHKSWNPEKRLFTNEASTWNYPMPAIGYEEVGEIIEVGSDVEKVKVGQVIWGVWGHKSTHIADQDWASDRVLDESVDPVCGIFSQIGAIALNAIIDANIHLGETVVVFGQGALGLMVTQLAKASGAEVIAVDRLTSRLEQATKNGADHVIDATTTNVGEKVSKLTAGKGADVCIEMTGAYPALNDAVRCAAYNSRVVVSGFFQGDGKGLFLGEEFHHNRIQLICSQIGGLSPSVDHRWDRLRLDQTVMKLIAKKVIDFTPLITHTFDAVDAQKAFELLEHNPNEALQVVLKYV